MSKATIVDNLGEGLYAVTIDYDTAEMDRAISALQAKLAETEADLLAAQDALIPLTEARQSAAADLDDAILAYKQALADDPSSADSGVTVEATKALAAASQAVSAQQRRIDVLIARKLALARRITFLQNSTGTQQPSAGTLVWCADYSEDADGTVPVAIVPGEQSTAPLVILPRQHPDGWAASYDREQFGQLVPRMSMTPAAAFYNWAMLPGWQRWMPTFRIGTVTFVDIETDTCNLTLEDAKSSAGPYPFSNGLNVNLAESTATMLSDVPIRYMTCNAAVFEAGDRVLVRFAQPSAANAGPGAWDGAEVIGFVSEPRPCFFPAIFSSTFINAAINYTPGDGWDHRDYTASEVASNYAYSSELDVGYALNITATSDGSRSDTGNTTRQEDLTFSASVTIQGTSVDVIDFVSDKRTMTQVNPTNVFSYSGTVRILRAGTISGEALFVDVFVIECAWNALENPYPGQPNGFAPKTVTRHRCVMIGGVEYVYETSVYETGIAQKGRQLIRDDGMGYPVVTGWEGSDNLGRFIWPVTPEFAAQSEFPTSAAATINVPDLSEPALFREGGTTGSGMDWTKIDNDIFSVSEYGQIPAKFVISEFSPIELSTEQKTALQQARKGELPVLSL